jgi:hypothetical protein
MTWQQIFPKAINPDPEYMEIERHARQVQRPAAAPSKKDIEQDAQIRALEQETRELRIYVAALIRLLGQKESIAPSEVEALIALADRVQQDIPPRDRRQRDKLRNLIRPSDPLANRQ